LIGDGSAEAHHTIEPGTILKLDDGASLDILASLTARGTAAAPIIFTSLKDDSAGGDTNNDGAASSPAAGDWDVLRVDFNPTRDPQNLDHVEVRYASTGLELVGSEDKTLTAVEISHAITGLLCRSAGNVVLNRVGVSQSTTGIDLEAGCSATITGGSVSRMTTGLDCDGVVGMDAVDIHQASIGLQVRGGCDALITGSSFVGNDLGIGIFNDDVGLDLGDLSDIDPTNNGGNDFACNTTDIHDFRMNTIKAENNWWGESPPEHAEIIGNIDIDPYLADGSNALIPDLEVSLHLDYQGNTDVRLAWHDRAPACGYRVWRSLAPDGGFTDISGHLSTGAYDDPGAGPAWMTTSTSSRSTDAHGVQACTSNKRE
jgi:hypothetical protein